MRKNTKKNTSTVTAFCTSLIIAIMSFTGLQLAHAEEGEGCISRKDMTELSTNFSQINTYLNKGKSEYCLADLGNEWFQIAHTLLLLKGITPNEPEIDTDDALTFKAIDEQNWWDYFTARAHKINIDSSCPPGVAAYIYFFQRGVVNLCSPLYFELGRHSQTSIMMHEVRHFDGHSHVTCTRGSEQGNRGACDNNITGRGSYAISVQTLVGLARSEDVSRANQIKLESEAAYMVFNKFNVLPQVKMSDYVYLTNQDGEVYKWSASKDDFSLIATLPDPSKIYNSFNNVTIYPLDPSVDAHRMDRSFVKDVKPPGLFAVHYNSEPVSERRKYKSVLYLGAGAMLKGDELLTICDGRNLAPKNLRSIGNFVNLISIAATEDPASHQTHLLNDKGELYSVSCVNSTSQNVDVESTGLKLDNLVSSSFTLGGKQYAILDTGEFVTLDLEGTTYTTSNSPLPFSNGKWIGATPLSIAEIFDVDPEEFDLPVLR